MITHYQSKNYTPDMVVKRYIRAGPGTHIYHWCEVGEDCGYDLRQGTCKASEVPEDIRAEADAVKDIWPSYVEWPS